MNSVSNVASIVGNGIVSRVKNAVNIIPCALAAILSIPATAVGLAATPFAALTCGKVEVLNILAKFSGTTTLILPKIFNVAMKILNPNCKISLHDKQEGYFQKMVASKVDAKIVDLIKCSNTFFKKEICSRLFVATMIPTLVVVKVADGILALPAVAASVLTFGCIPKVNQFAYDNLKSFSSIPAHISFGLRLTINPHIALPTNQKRN